MQQLTPKALFTALDAERGDLLSRCEEYAEWTIPATFPMVGQQNQELVNPWNALGPRLVNNLSNKMMMALFSPSKPFFRLSMDEQVKAQVMAVSGAEAAQIDAALSKAERKGWSKMARWKLRTSLTMLIQQLIVVGNGLLFIDKERDASQAYSLRDYVIKRDLSGVPVCIVTRDRKSPATVPDAYQKYIPMNKRMQGLSSVQQELDLYTVIVRKDDSTYEVIQAFDDNIIPETKTTYKADVLPWIPCVWKLPRGWNYGVGLVEEYAGDFHAVNEIAKSVNAGVAEACDIKKLVNPAGVTDVDELNSAETGAYVSGIADDISVPTLGMKVDDFSFGLAWLQWYEQRLGEAFLLNSAVTRDAERVTAEEIRLQAQELETSHAGIYSRQSEDLQLPLANLFMEDIDLELKEDALEPVIVTGMDALSRMSEHDQIMMFIQDLALIGSVPEAVQAWIETPNMIAMLGANRGVDYQKFLKSPDKKAADDKAAMQQMVALQGATAQATAQPQ